MEENFDKMAKIDQEELMIDRMVEDFNKPEIPLKISKVKLLETVGLPISKIDFIKLWTTKKMTINNTSKKTSGKPSAQIATKYFPKSLARKLNAHIAANLCLSALGRKIMLALL